MGVDTFVSHTDCSEGVGLSQCVTYRSRDKTDENGNSVFSDLQETLLTRPESSGASGCFLQSVQPAVVGSDASRTSENRKTKEGKLPQLEQSLSLVFLPDPI